MSLWSAVGLALPWYSRRLCTRSENPTHGRSCENDTTRFSVVVAQLRNYYQSKFGFQDITGFSLVEFSTSQLARTEGSNHSGKHRVAAKLRLHEAKAYGFCKVLPPSCSYEVEPPRR